MDFFKDKHNVENKVSLEGFFMSILMISDS